MTRKQESMLLFIDHQMKVDEIIIIITLLGFNKTVVINKKINSFLRKLNYLFKCIKSSLHVQLKALRMASNMLLF